MDIELTPAAENYLSAVAKGQIPKTRGAAGLAIQRKLIKSGLLTEKGNPTKKARHYFETPEEPDVSTADGIPVYEEDDEDRIIGYMEPEESTGMKLYDLYVLIDTERKDIGFTKDEANGINRIRKEYHKLINSDTV